MKHLRSLGTALLIAGSLGATASSAQAGEYRFANNIGMGSGGNYNGGPFQSNISKIRGHGTYGAYSGVWIVNGSGTRVSALDWCETDNCWSQVTWPGSKPSGQGNIHHHGGLSSDVFNGWIYW